LLVHPRLKACYRIRSDARSIDARARALAVEQSVEMPVAAIDDAFVRAEIVGEVEAISELEKGLFEVRIALAQETVGADPGQLLNMLFGNSSLHEDVVLHDVELPARLAKSLGGPGHGLHALRQRVGAHARALTCSVLKPQGFSPTALADLASAFASGGYWNANDRFVRTHPHRAFGLSELRTSSCSMSALAFSRRPATSSSSKSLNMSAI
jgi:ribulose-bisphosphate carboxylase large chain